MALWDNYAFAIILCYTTKLPDKIKCCNIYYTLTMAFYKSLIFFLGECKMYKVQ